MMSEALARKYSTSPAALVSTLAQPPGRQFKALCSPWLDTAARRHLSYHRDHLAGWSDRACDMQVLQVPPGAVHLLPQAIMQHCTSRDLPVLLLAIPAAARPDVPAAAASTACDNHEPAPGAGSPVSGVCSSVGSHGPFSSAPASTDPRCTSVDSAARSGSASGCMHGAPSAPPVDDHASQAPSTSDGSAALSCSPLEPPSTPALPSSLHCSALPPPALAPLSSPEAAMQVSLPFTWLQHERDCPLGCNCPHCFTHCFWQCSRQLHACWQAADR